MPRIAPTPTPHNKELSRFIRNVTNAEVGNPWERHRNRRRKLQETLPLRSRGTEMGSATGEDRHTQSFRARHRGERDVQGGEDGGRAREDPRARACSSFSLADELPRPSLVALPGPPGPAPWSGPGRPARPAPHVRSQRSGPWPAAGMPRGPHPPAPPPSGPSPGPQPSPEARESRCPSYRPTPALRVLDPQLSPRSQPGRVGPWTSSVAAGPAG